MLLALILVRQRAYAFPAPIGTSLPLLRISHVLLAIRMAASILHVRWLIEMTVLVWLSWVGVVLLLGTQFIPGRKRLMVCRGHAILGVEGALSHVRLVALLDFENWIIEADLILVHHCQVG